MAPYSKGSNRTIGFQYISFLSFTFPANAEKESVAGIGSRLKNAFLRKKFNGKDTVICIVFANKGIENNR